MFVTVSVLSPHVMVSDEGRAKAGIPHVEAKGCAAEVGDVDVVLDRTGDALTVGDVVVRDVVEDLGVDVVADGAARPVLAGVVVVLRAELVDVVDAWCVGLVVVAELDDVDDDVAAAVLTGVELLEDRVEDVEWDDELDEDVTVEGKSLDDQVVPPVAPPPHALSGRVRTGSRMRARFMLSG